MPETQLADAQFDHLWKRRNGTIYRIRLSVLYHLKRMSFFDGVDKAVSIMTAFTATAAVAVLLKRSGDYELYLTALTAFLALVPLVYNPAQKAREHAQTASEFRRLLAECERAGEYWTEDMCDNMGARAVELEATEPAPLAALVADCQNQLAIARGIDGNLVVLNWRERWFKHWFEFDASKIATRSRA